jgi:hypothetical protein
MFSVLGELKGSTPPPLFFVWVEVLVVRVKDFRVYLLLDDSRIGDS